MPQVTAIHVPTLVSACLSATTDEGFLPAVFPLFCLAGIGVWPNVTRILHDQAVAILRDLGPCALERQGGRQRADGLLGFGRFSSAALSTVLEVLDRSSGFWFVDESGTSWAARVNPRPGAPYAFTGWAITYRPAPSLLDPAWRRRVIDQAERTLRSYRQPGRAWTPDEQLEFARIARLARRAERLADALQILPMLANDMADSAPGTCLPVTVELATNRAVEAEITAELSQLEIMQFSTVATGWGIVAHYQAAALSAIERLGREGLRVTVSPRLKEVIQMFSDR